MPNDLLKKSIREQYTKLIAEVEQSGATEQVWLYERALKAVEAIFDGTDRVFPLPISQDNFNLLIDIDILADCRQPSERRSKAAKFILERFNGKVIPHQRWNFVRPALERLAVAHIESRPDSETDLDETPIQTNSNIEPELDAHVIGALYLIAAQFMGGVGAQVDKKKDVADLSFDQVMNADSKRLRREVGDEATASILGPDWRKIDDRESHKSIQHQQEHAPTARPKPEFTPLVDEVSGDVETPETLISDREQQKRRILVAQQLIERIAAITGKHPAAVKATIERRELDSLVAIAAEFRIERTRFYREVVNPIRETLSES